MRRIALAAACIGIVFLVRAGGADDTRRGPSGTLRKVAIDGRSFRANGNGSDNAAHLCRSLRKRGLSSLGGLPAADLAAMSPTFAAPLVECDETPPTAPVPAPFGLRFEHVLRMERDGEDIELLLGKMNSSASSVQAHWIEQGWTPAAPQKTTQAVRLLRRSRGKETEVVFLDEKRRTFLLFRKMVR
jgi:hypothetical protein